MMAQEQDDDELPPWRLERRDGLIYVTDGIIALGNSDQVDALALLGDASRIWPGGTAKPTAEEVRRARARGARRGFLDGYIIGFIAATLLHLVAWWVWS